MVGWLEVRELLPQSAIMDHFAAGESAPESLTNVALNASSSELAWILVLPIGARGHSDQRKADLIDL